MDSFIIILTALLPIAVFLWYIYYKDRKSPEPINELLKAFLYGVGAVPLSLCMSMPLKWMGVYSSEATNVLGCISEAFFGAAIPEEIAKLFVLWMVLRKNRYFDLFSNTETYLSVGLARAIFAVPGHFCFGILMGYYYSLAKFYPKSTIKNKALVLIAPILVHGLYDSILFIINVTPAVSGILLIVFLVFCRKMWKYGSKKIKEHLERDNDRNCQYDCSI